MFSQLEANTKRSAPARCCGRSPWGTKGSCSTKAPSGSERAISASSRAPGEPVATADQGQGQIVAPTPQLGHGPHHMPLMLVERGLGNVEAADGASARDRPGRVPLDLREILADAVRNEGDAIQPAAGPLDHLGGVPGQEDGAVGPTQRPVLHQAQQLQPQAGLAQAEAFDLPRFVGEHVAAHGHGRPEVRDGPGIGIEHDVDPGGGGLPRQGRPLPEDLFQQRLLQRRRRMLDQPRPIGHRPPAAFRRTTGGPGRCRSRPARRCPADRSGGPARPRSGCGRRRRRRRGRQSGSSASSWTFLIRQNPIVAGPGHRETP